MPEAFIHSPLENWSSVDAHVAKRLREARAGLSITQADLGRRLGFTQATVSLWESGARKVGLSELDALARALEKPLGYFLDWPSPDDRGGERELVVDPAESGAGEDAYREGRRTLDEALDRITSHGEER